ncbi:sodium/proton antiporter [Pasteurella multocida subsp. multocida str. Anand1_buffalo]|nr:sodium/proton antiporter [Pasteurella multocida subsp. multocida str. Anand1_buffalo]
MALPYTIVLSCIGLLAVEYILPGATNVLIQIGLLKPM